MNLLARQTERAIKAAARRELRRDDGSWREFKRRRQRIKPLVWKTFGVLPMVGLPALTLVCLQRQALEARAGWAVLILFVLLCSGVATLVSIVAQRAQLLERLPITDRDIFRVSWRGLIIASLWSLPAFFFLFHWLVPGGNRDELWLHAEAAILLLATLLAAVCVALAWFRAAQWAPLCVSFGSIGSFVCIQAAGDDGSPMIRAMVDQLGKLVRFATPPGWVVTWFIERLGGEAHAALWLVPVFAGFAISFVAYKKLRDTVAVTESTLRLPQLTPIQAMQLQQVIRRKELSLPSLIGPTAIEESLKARDFLRPRAGLNVGWIDQRVWRWLTVREQTLLDFMVLVLPRWTAMWKYGVIAAAGGLVLGELLRASRPDDFALASGFGGLCMLVMALPMSNGLARAFVACPVAGGAPLTFAGCLPISYAEILRLDLKISLVRTLAALPAALAFGAALAWQIKLPLLIGILAALKVAFCVMALRPLMVSASFSAGTNDTQLSKFRGWVMFVLVVSIAFVSLGLAVASVIVTNWWSLILMFVFALLSWGFHAIHRRRYDRMGFDLQPSTLVGQHPVG